MAEPLAEYGTLAAGSAFDLLGEKDSYDAAAAAAWEYSVCSFVGVGAGAGLTAAGGDCAVVAAVGAFCGAAPVVDDTGGVVAAVFVVWHEADGCAVAAADVVDVAVSGGIHCHSGLGCPTLGCCCYSTVH